MIFGVKSERFIAADTGQTSLFDTIEKPGSESRDCATEISPSQGRICPKRIQKKPVSLALPAHTKPHKMHP